MIEEIVLNRLSYSSLISLLKNGELKNQEKLKIQKLAHSRPLHEKRLHQLMQKREV